MTTEPLPDERTGGGPVERVEERAEEQVEARAEARRRRPGLRLRVVAATVALLAVSFALTIAIARQMLLERLERQIEQELAQEVEELRAVVTAGVGEVVAGPAPPADAPPADAPAEGPPEGGIDVARLLTVFLEGNVPADDEAFYTLVDGRPHLASFGADPDLLDDPALLARWTALRTPTREDLVTPDGERSALVVPVLGSDGARRGTFVVTIDPGNDRDEIGDVVRTLLVVSLLVLGAGAAASWSLAGRVLLPVRELTAAARATGAGDLRRRIETDGDDELAELGHTFNGMLDRLERSFHGQRAFLDDVAHELRTPITIVRGHLELLPVADAESEHAVALMTDELDRMSRYVDDLLVVAKSRRPDFLRPELVDVADIVDGALQRASAMADREWQRGPTPPAGTVLTEADPDRLMQAILALVTNAVQHTGDGDRISVGVELVDRAAPPDARPHAAGGRADEIVFSVTDNGTGIAEQDLPRIFERFSRGPASSSSRPGGTGLGLAIVSAIAAAHGGRTSVTSVARSSSTTIGTGATRNGAPGTPDAPDQAMASPGSTFRLHIPRTLAEDLP